jgi:hypothetical protein
MSLVVFPSHWGALRAHGEASQRSDSNATALLFWSTT